MAFNRKPNSPVAIINRLGIADYYCGICGRPLLKMVSVLDAPLPSKCPHCGKTVDRKSRHEEAKQDARAVVDKRERTKELVKMRLVEMQANPNDLRHGTKTGYAYGCRCERCVQAHSAYQRKIYLRRKR